MDTMSWVLLLVTVLWLERLLRCRFWRAIAVAQDEALGKTNQLLNLQREYFQKVEQVVYDAYPHIKVEVDRQMDEWRKQIGKNQHSSGS